MVNYVKEDFELKELGAFTLEEVLKDGFRQASQKIKNTMSTISINKNTNKTESKGTRIIILKNNFIY